MKKKLSGCLILILASLLFCSIAFAQDVSVNGKGATRDDALRDAFRTAVEQAVGTLVDSQTLVRNYQVVTDDIYTKSQGFVQDYQVTNEQVVGGIYVLTVSVNVNTQPDSRLYSQLQQLQLIEVMLRDPRIAVLIPEYHQASAWPDSASENAVTQKLRDAGFRHILDARQLQAIEKNKLVRAILDGNYEAAKIMATTQQLDFVIVGEATSQDVGNLYDSGIQSSRAHIDAKVLKVDTGEIVAAQGFEASGVDITPLVAAKKALAAAGSQVGDYMVQQLMQYASDPDKPLTITIKRASFNKLNLIQTSLKQISGVKAVFLRSYDSGIAQIDVTYTGSPKVLADALQNTDGVTLDITGITNSTVEAVLR
jgi:hypothetical protein